MQDVERDEATGEREEKDRFSSAKRNPKRNRGILKAIYLLIRLVGLGTLGSNRRGRQNAGGESHAGIWVLCAQLSAAQRRAAEAAEQQVAASSLGARPLSSAELAMRIPSSPHGNALGHV